MPPTIVPFTEEHIQQAAELFAERYRRERASSPLLPTRAVDEPEWICGELRARVANPGVAAVEGGRLIGYMLTGARFAWKGQRAALIPPHCHAAGDAGPALYQRMYMELAQAWVDERINLHLIGHFAHDAPLQETLFQLGFGAILAERLRSLADVGGRRDLAVGVEQDPGRLVAIQTEHSAFYPRSPIFIQKPTGRAEVLAELEEHAQAGDAFLVHSEGREPRGYMIVGESAVGAEGLLLERTNTAQVKSAFVQPALRGGGVGAALLQRAVEWSRERGYERLFVEHETANLFGGSFWRKHFDPYLHFSMRFVDSTLAG